MSDLISREDAIEKCKEFADRDTTSTEEAIGAEYCIDFLKELPSAELKTAKAVSIWKPIEVSDQVINVTFCELCERVVSIFDDYCPGCGARLEWQDGI